MPLAIFGSINPLEILVVGVAALLIFGPRLPEVTLRLVAHVMRARRAVTKMWRETGLEDELRRVRRDIELSIPRDADFDIQSPVRKALTRTADTSSTPSGTEGDPNAEDPDAEDPDADRAEEPFDSSVTIEPADDIIASGEWDPAIDSASDSEADRREPDADADTYADPAGLVQGTDLAPDEDPGEDVDAPKATD
jgi:Sec-independent protein translocase protein TatA